MRVNLGISLATMADASQSLVALTLSNASFDEGDTAGTIIGAVQGLTAGSTLTLASDGGGKASLSGTNLVVGLTVASAGTFNVTLREELAGASNSPNLTIITISVVDAGATVFDQTMDWGKLTTSGNGGIAPETNGAATGWSITGGTASSGFDIDSDTGVITPNATYAGALPHGGTLSISTDQGSFTVTLNTEGTIGDSVDLSTTKSVASLSELMAVTELGTSYTGAGVTIALRGGTYATASQSWANRFKNITSGTVRITCHDYANRAVSDGFSMSTDAANYRWDHLIFYYPWVQGASANHYIMALNSNPTNVRIDHNIIRSDIPKGRLWTPDMFSPTAIGYGPQRPFIQGIVFTAVAVNCEVDHNIYHNLAHCLECYGGVHNHDNHGFWVHGDFLHILAGNGVEVGDYLGENNLFHDTIGNSYLHSDTNQSYEPGGSAGGDISNVRERGLLSFPGYEGVRSPPVVTTGFGKVVDADYTMNTNEWVMVDTTDGDVTLTLPDATTADHNVTVQKIYGDNDVIIVPAGSDTITYDYLGSGQTSLTISEQWKAFKLEHTAGVWTASRQAPSLQGWLNQNIGAGTYLNWTMEGSVIWTTSTHGWTFETDADGARLRNVTLLRVWPGDVNGDGIEDEADGLQTGTRPIITFPSTGDNIAYRCVTGSVINGTSTENLLLPSATKSDYTDQFAADDANDLMPIWDEGDYYVLADDGYVDIENFETRLQTLREAAATCVLARTGSDMATNGQGAVGTALDTGFYDFTTGAANYGPRLLVTTSYTAAVNDPYDITLKADLPIETWSIEGGAGAASYSISGNVLTLGSESSGSFVVTVRATDYDGRYTDFDITTTIDTGTPTADFLWYYASGTNKSPGQSYTIAAQSLGTPHADRVLVMLVSTGQTVSSVTVGGNAMTELASASQGRIMYLPLASGSTGDVVVTIDSGASTNATIALAMFVCYPASSTPVDYGAIYNSSLSNIEVVNGGSLFLFDRGTSSADPITISWNGADTVTQDAHGTVETWAYSAYHAVTTEDATTGDVTSSSTSDVLLAVSFGAPA